MHRAGHCHHDGRVSPAFLSHTHYHCAVIDGVFSERDGALCFHPASALGEADVAVVATRVLRLFERRGVLSCEAACEMASWGHNSGFSLDASVRIEAKDRAGLECLLWWISGESNRR